jgi:hypothetical protein
MPRHKKTRDRKPKAVKRHVEDTHIIPVQRPEDLGPAMNNALKIPKAKLSPKNLPVKGGKKKPLFPVKH